MCQWQAKGYLFTLVFYIRFLWVITFFGVRETRFGETVRHWTMS